MTLKDSSELVTFVGYDDWHRALFETKSGVEVVDVDGELYSINRYMDWAEPDCPLGYATPEVDNEQSNV